MAESGVLTSSDFRRISDMLRTRVGISLSDKKRGLLTARLGSMMRARGYTSYGELADRLERDPEGPLFIELVNRLSTNHTYFDREPMHFTFLAQDLVPRWEAELTQGRRERVRIWSAAASSGEEPYNLAMTISDHSDAVRAASKILGTDIAGSALEKADKGIYGEKELARLAQSRRAAHFERTSQGERISQHIRDMVVFRRLNLVRDTYPFRHMFDLIFCRNVLIYFDEDLQQSIVNAMMRHLTMGGHLVVGHSETLDRGSFGLQYRRPGVYQRTGDSKGATS
ncbi:MAG TPA: protein-glutamate O-methyltransferase CheR [Alkalispirochaeta sp.]|nr:protein-glutamate O-methyltransferase CheR [Alkalispirochaeta sp.]